MADGVSHSGGVIARSEMRDLVNDVAVGVRRGFKGLDPAADDGFQGLNELCACGHLEVQSRLAHALLLAELNERELGRQQRVLEDANENVRAGEMRARSRRAATELVLVQRDHRVRYLREEMSFHDPPRDYSCHGTYGPLPPDGAQG